MFSAPWFIRDNVPDVPAEELRAEAKQAAASFAIFQALYGPRGPMRRLIEYGELDLEMFRLCGVVVTELTAPPAYDNFEAPMDDAPTDDERITG